MLYIDADYLAHRFTWNRTMDEAKKETDVHLKSILEELFEEDFTLVMAGKDNFRKEIYPDYKANRKPMEEEKKEFFNEYNQWVAEEYGAIRADGQEADDVVATLATQNDGIIVSPDKDLRTVPGKLFNPQTWTYELIDENTADYLFHLQLIEGDRSDNIPAVPGMGPVKSKKALGNKPLGKRLSRVKAIYRANALDKEYLQLMADLLWIRRNNQERYVV